MPKSWNHLNFVNISPSLVIDASMEGSSRVLQHGNPKIWFFFQKNLKLNFTFHFDLCHRSEIVLVGLNMNLYDDIGDALSSLRGSTSSWYINGKVFRNTTAWKPIFFSKKLKLNFDLCWWAEITLASSISVHTF